MKSKLFTLSAAATLVVSQAALAASTQSAARSVGAFPVVADDYPEAALTLKAGDDVVLTVTGEARTRFEYVENTTDFSSSGASGSADDAFFDDSFSYGASRYDLGFRVDLPRNVAAVVDLQGAFTYGGDLAGLGTQIRAQSTQHQRPGVINPILFGPSLSQVNNINGAIGDSADPTHLEVVRELRSALTDGIHVYQGYIEAANVGGSKVSVRIGRQELAYGTEFLLGNQDFYDGQSYDAVKGIFQFNDTNRLDLFWAKLAERDTTAPGSVASPALSQGGNDSDLYGAYFSTSSLGGSSVGMDAYLLNLRDLGNFSYNLAVLKNPDGSFDINDSSYNVANGGRSFLDSWWAGLRFFRDREHGFHFSTELTYQWGAIDSNFTNDGIPGNEMKKNINLSAWAFEGFFGYTWNHSTNPTIKGGVTYASGSTASDYSRANWHTFFTPAGEVHPRLGLMDLVDASNILSANLGYTGSHGNHSWGVDLYDFRFDHVDPLVEDFFVSNAAMGMGHRMSRRLGDEVDLWYNYQYSRNLVAQFALGWFDAGQFIKDRNNCPGGGCDPSDDTTFPGNKVGTDNAWRVYANMLLRF